MVKRFSVEFLGCKVNQYEVEALREGFRGLGLEEAPDPGSSDLHVLNTCSVTQHAGATSRKHLRRIIRNHPGARVLVTGCYAESDRAVLDAIDGVDRVFGNREKDDILGYVARDVLGRDPSEPLPALRVSRVTGQTRAFVKIEDGCEDSCTFCIIPTLRGGATSRPPEEVVQEVRELVANGHREVVLTGIHLGYYGRGQTGMKRGEPLARLLRDLARVPGLERLKLSSIEVHEITDELIDVFASSPVFAPHFHLPLQSGCDGTLARMRRKYNTRIFRDRCAALRAAIDAPAVSTDVIVGFPGETEADFAETVAFCEEIGFMRLHVFPFSVREGTPAATMPDQLPVPVIDARKGRLIAAGDVLAASWRQRWAGARASVLVEERRDPGSGLLSGLSERYVRVLLDGGDRLIGQLVDVEVGAEIPGTGAVGGSLLLEGIGAS